MFPVVRHGSRYGFRVRTDPANDAAETRRAFLLPKLHIITIRMENAWTVNPGNSVFPV
jgi:hypothetical protein